MPYSAAFCIFRVCLPPATRATGRPDGLTVPRFSLRQSWAPESRFCRFGDVSASFSQAPRWADGRTELPGGGRLPREGVGPGSPPEVRLQPRESLQVPPRFQGNDTPASPSTCCPARKGTRQDPGQRTIRQSRDRCEGRPPDVGGGHPRPSSASPGETGVGGGRLGLQAGGSWGEWG